MILEVEDADQQTLARAFRRLACFADVIERFGLRHTLRVLAKDPDLQKAIMVDAQCGDPFGSTIVIR